MKSRYNRAVDLPLLVRYALSMSLNAHITLDLERFTLTGPVYVLHTLVDTSSAAKTDPPQLFNSLLVCLSTISQPDYLARVCNRGDLELYPEVVAAPVVPYEFHPVKLHASDIQTNMASILVGDDVIINPVPALWSYIRGVLPFTARVLVVGGTGTDYILVDTDFPAYSDVLTYQVTEHLNPANVRASGTDGVACRHNPASALYCRTVLDYTCFTDILDATDKLEAVRAQALGLAKEFDRTEEEFLGTSVELFE